MNGGSDTRRNVTKQSVQDEGSILQCDPCRAIAQLHASYDNSLSTQNDDALEEKNKRDES